MKQFISFVRKEFYHIFRDARTTMILLLMPVILIILFGYAITTEIKRVPIAIFDQSRDELTLKMTDRLNASEYFELYTTVDSYEDAGALFRQGKVHVIVVFPPGYASTADAQVQVLADATDPNEATQLIAYCSAIIAEQLKGESAVEGKAVTPVTTLLYNPQMKGAYNFVPGVMGLILILICAMMTSIGIVKEKEMGTMEVLLVSPLKPIYIIDIPKINLDRMFQHFGHSRLFRDNRRYPRAHRFQRRNPERFGYRRHHVDITVGKHLLHILAT